MEAGAGVVTHRECPAPAVSGMGAIRGVSAQGLLLVVTSFLLLLLAERVAVPEELLVYGQRPLLPRGAGGLHPRVALGVVLPGVLEFTLALFTAMLLACALGPLYLCRLANVTRLTACWISVMPKDSAQNAGGVWARWPKPGV